jgi:hypothetical protein
MNTLGQQYKAAQARVARGEAVQPNALLSPDNTRNRPSPVDALAVLRASFQAVVRKAQANFISGIAANLYTGEVLQVCSYIPHTEACYWFLDKGINLRAQSDHDGDPDCLRLTAAVPETKEIVDDIWHPFLNWVKAQGLRLHMSGLGEAYGVREFLVLEVWAPEDEPETKAEAAALA